MWSRRCIQQPPPHCTGSKAAWSASPSLLPAPHLLDLPSVYVAGRCSTPSAPAPSAAACEHKGPSPQSSGMGPLAQSQTSDLVCLHNPRQCCMVQHSRRQQRPLSSTETIPSPNQTLADAYLHLVPPPCREVLVSPALSHQHSLSVWGKMGHLMEPVQTAFLLQQYQHPSRGIFRD